jgi:hypothetical protein
MQAAGFIERIRNPTDERQRQQLAHAESEDANHDSEKADHHPGPSRCCGSQFAGGCVSCGYGGAPAHRRTGRLTPKPCDII